MKALMKEHRSQPTEKVKEGTTMPLEGVMEMDLP
jgi:hypothetical protein